MTETSGQVPEAVQSLATLLDLSRRARHASSASELGFLLANDTHELAPYRQAAFWLADKGLHTLSGLVQIEANAPYALWLSKVCSTLAAQEFSDARALTASDLPPELAQDWLEWWPAHALWLALPGKSEAGAPAAVSAGLLLVRELPWLAEEQALLREWVDMAWHAFGVLRKPQGTSWSAAFKRVRASMSVQADRPWWRQPALRWTAVVLAVLAVPVRLTVLAPGELVPARPVMIRAPLDGVVDVFHVQPNERVTKDQALFGFDEALIQSRREVAAQALATAETEYRQTSQQALSDPKAKPQLAMLTGKIEEKRAEVDFLQEQLSRARVLAPQAGIALFDDPAEWIGRPVAVGERIMRIAAPDDVEIEAWLPLADAIALPNGASVSLYLNASPLFSVSAHLRYVAHDAVQRPDGSFAYRVRATLDEPTGHRVGLKGTAKLNGAWVPLVYWVLRRPWATVRSTLGL